MSDNQRVSAAHLIQTRHRAADRFQGGRHMAANLERRIRRLPYLGDSLETPARNASLPTTPGTSGRSSRSRLPDRANRHTGQSSRASKDPVDADPPARVETPSRRDLNR